MSRIIPEIGVHRNVPERIYHGAWDAASNSQLSKLRRSPAHLKAYLDEPPDTTALAIGRAIHCAILEPAIFDAKYARAPEGDRRTKAVKDAWGALELCHGPDAVLKAADYDVCLKARAAMHAHVSAAAMLAGVTDTELSLVWDDAETGVRCKARVDGYAPSIAGGTIVDLKTTKDASLREFERSIFTFGYHRQAAMYLDAATALGVEAEHFVIIAVEKEPPFAVAVYRLTEGAIDAGREQLRPLLRTYGTCLALNEWPCYPQTVQDIALPSWSWAQIDEEISMRAEAEVTA